MAWRETWIACGVLAATLAACSDASGGAVAPTVAETAAMTAVPTIASAPAPTTTVLIVSTSSLTTTTSTSTSTFPPATTTTSTTTTLPVTTTSEVARSRPPSRLRRPDGFARRELDPVWEGEAALTGLLVDPAIWSRPALAVKIDNAPSGRPQWNLADADLIIEENVEGITRFIAVYQSNTPDRVGPVRSARTSDLDILSAFNRPILAWSGGNVGVTLAVRGAHKYGWLSNLSAQSTDCFWRSATRSAPHNLLLDPLCAWQSTTYAGPARPVFARDPAVPAGSPLDRFRVEMDGITVTWQWDTGSGRYLRRQRGDWHTDVDGDIVGAVNVVELFVGYVPSAIDARSPEAITVGSGQLRLHRNGVSVTGSWSRPDRFSMFTLVADDGTPLSLSPGTVFVELVR